MPRRRRRTRAPGREKSLVSLYEAPLGIGVVRLHCTILRRDPPTSPSDRRSVAAKPRGRVRNDGPRTTTPRRCCRPERRLDEPFPGCGRRRLRGHAGAVRLGDGRPRRARPHRHVLRSRRLAPYCDRISSGEPVLRNFVPCRRRVPHNRPLPANVRRRASPACFRNARYTLHSQHLRWCMSIVSFDLE
jgi:hypothetical protein